MSNYEHTLLQWRHAELEAMAEQHRLRQEARRGLHGRRTPAPQRVLRAVRSLRLDARRLVKRRRALT